MDVQLGVRLRDRASDALSFLIMMLHCTADLWKGAVDQALRGNGWNGRGTMRLIDPPPGFSPSGPPE